MLYLFTLTIISVWMVVKIRRKKLSLHSLVNAYVISVFIIDMMEVFLNLLLNRYKFPTHLINNPTYDNQLGLIFADGLILPFAYIIFTCYNKRSHPWRTTIPFAILFVILELIYLKLGYLQYNNWKVVYSAVIYLMGFRVGAYLAPGIVTYSPPVPYPLRLLGFSYTAIMWVGATFGMPVFKLYQFKTGLFDNFMVDDRFIDLYSGMILGGISALLIPRIPTRLKLISFTVIACIGVSFAFYFYMKGWLIYHYWNHLLTVIRYFVPFILIMLYDRWEMSYQTPSKNPGRTVEAG